MQYLNNVNKWYSLIIHAFLKSNNSRGYLQSQLMESGIWNPETRNPRNLKKKTVANRVSEKHDEFPNFKLRVGTSFYHLIRNWSPSQKSH